MRHDAVQAFMADLKSCRRERSWWDSNPYAFAALIRLYGKCGCMAEARRMFDSVRSPDVVSWNTLISGYAANGEGQASLNLFFRMKHPIYGCAPSSITYVAALKACTSLAAGGSKVDPLSWGRKIHNEAGMHLDSYVRNTLVDMYAKCGCMPQAQRVFDTIAKPDVVSWTALISGYAENGDGVTALEIFTRMKSAKGCTPNAITYVAALKACTTLATEGDREKALERGREIHIEAARHTDVYVQNTLIDMYSKCETMIEARRVFNSMRKPDIVSWNALLLGYAENADGQAALGLFSRMKAERTVLPDPVTYVAVIKACTSLAAKGARRCALERGREIHLEIGCLQQDAYVKSALIDMYSTCGSMAEARRVFDSIHNPDVVCWNALLLGYASNAMGRAALEAFSEMKAARNSVTCMAVLKSCALVGALTLGRKLHAGIAELTPKVLTSLVDFYANCGSMAEACEAFDASPRLTELSTWTALSAGHSRFGDSGFVLNLFGALNNAGLRPDAVAFVCVLSCCSHAGLVETARGCFEAMRLEYGITPDVRHYTCMLDVLGRANQLKEAMEALKTMPCSPDVVTWMTLLTASHKFKNVEIGRSAFQALVEMDNKVAPAYVLMANLYGSLSMWEEQQKIMLDMKHALGLNSCHRL